MNIFKKAFYIFLLIFITGTVCSAQEVKISRDVNVKNDIAYDIMYIAGNAYLYRDKGNEYFFDIFDKDLNYKRTQELELETKKAKVENIHAIDSFINVYYSMKKEGRYYLKALKFDESLIAIDTTTIYESDDYIEAGEFRNILSEDKSKLALFNLSRKDALLFLIDTRSLVLEQKYDLQVDDYRLPDQFEEVEVSNFGDVFILLEKENSSWDKEKHYMRLLTFSKGLYYISEISAINTINSGVKMSYDNINQQIAIAGLWSSKSEIEMEGYFTLLLRKNELLGINLYEINKQLFDENILKDLNGLETKTKNNYLNDFYLKDIMHRQDGGIILITEMAREFSRRNASPNFDRSFGARSYMEFYHEDMALFSINPNGEQLWRKILFKKQYSQDDDGIYSSFFVLKVPSQMHIIFNDEIRNANTVSEYIIDPLGNFKRNSVLTTEYKNLKIRFKDGIQTSSNSFLVPSEKGGKINLVKITL